MATIPIPNLTAAISVTGTEEIPAVQFGVAVRITAAQIAALGGGGGGGSTPTVLQKRSTHSATGSFVLATSDIGGGYVEHTLEITGNNLSSSNAQLPTVSILATSLSVVAGQTYKLKVINTGTSNWTLTTNTGWTLIGILTIFPNTFVEYYVTFNTPTTATIQSV